MSNSEEEYPEYESKDVSGFDRYAFTLLIGSIVGSATAIAIFVLLIAFSAIATGGASLVPTIAIISAWGLGLGAGLFSIGFAGNNLVSQIENRLGWFAMMAGMAGTFATIGAIVGTFIPLPIVGSLAGAALGAVAGAVIGFVATVLIGWGIAFIIAMKKEYNDRKLPDSLDDFDSSSNYKSDNRDQNRADKEKQYGVPQKIFPFGRSFKPKNDNDNDNPNPEHEYKKTSNPNSY